MANKLARETSPYLLQHADNPVDWFAWNEEALQRARQKNRPILLSIGYSACHWCHVMAHECFEDVETAKLMNRLFVSIKVDREERPDLDKIYQSAHQLISRSPGGWPLTVFLTAEGHLPIFSGTYFPREQFKQLLTRVESFSRSHKGEIESQGRILRDALANLAPSSSGSDSAKLTEAPIRLARKQLEASFDPEYAGFGGAPKFPHPTNIEALLSTWRATATTTKPDLDALDMATSTLSRMATGGLYDQVGGGFYRYSVDQRWAIPHFEKMLYDNAALLAVYSDGFAATDEALFGRIATETADWVIRDMQDPDGGYYATLDADSEGQEGRFYLWTPAQLDALLTTEENTVAREHYGLDLDANFEGEAWHLHVAVPIDDLGTGMSSDRAKDALKSARKKMLASRNTRVWPERDEKILVAWNGLMIKAMARAALILGRPDLADSASRAADFIHSQMWRDGRLLASFKDQRAQFPAYLDDYAFLADGLMDLLRYRWRSDYLAIACQLADVLLARFEDPNGGFFFTADDHETLIHRPKPYSDEATPSGNGVATQVLLRLGHLLGETRYLDAAERTLRAAWPVLQQYPQAHGTLLQALRAYLEPPEIIVVRGDPDALADWQRYISAGYNPGRMSLIIPNDEETLPGLLQERAPKGDAIAYVCEGTVCRAPVTNLEELAATLATVET
ncbi:MAG: thioredoxin domain-containing protein [Gammaproteobacteria bacterium]|nr:thioredoxin domain-containing protein [Gammaproteobacteria bacterium]